MTTTYTKEFCIEEALRAADAAMRWEELGHSANAEACHATAQRWDELAAMHWKTRTAKLVCGNWLEMGLYYTAPTDQHVFAALEAKETERQIFDAVESAVRLIEDNFSGERFGDNPALTSPLLARDYLRLKLFDQRVEQFWAIYMTPNARVIDCKMLTTGTVDETRVYPREIVRDAVLMDAARVIVCHNHPSGRIQESDADIKLTGMLRDALNMVGVSLVDHLIVARGAISSLAEKGLV